jgi:hypothetical protein
VLVFGIPGFSFGKKRCPKTIDRLGQVRREFMCRPADIFVQGHVELCFGRGVIRIIRFSLTGILDHRIRGRTLADLRGATVVRK